MQAAILIGCRHTELLTLTAQSYPSRMFIACRNLTVLTSSQEKINVRQAVGCCGYFVCACPSAPSTKS